jgi:hypothetical protein
MEVCSEFENRFGMLFACDQAILVANKVVMSLRAMDFRDQYELRTLLEDITTKSGLTNDWEIVKSGVTRFRKKSQWLATEDQRRQESTQRSWLAMEIHQLQTRDRLVETGINVSMLEELLKGIVDLKIAGMRRADERPSTSNWHSIWCNDAIHVWRRCNEYKEALHCDLIYYEGNNIYSVDSQKQLQKSC